MSKIAGANGALLRGRRDLAARSATRACRATSRRASTSIAASPAGSDVAEARRRDGPVRRPRGRAGRPLESRRGGRDRREPEPAGGAVSRLSRHAPTTGSPSSSSARAAIAARSAPRWCSSRASSGSGASSTADRASRARTTGACTSGSGTREWVDRVVDPLAVGHASRCCRAPRSIAFVTVTEPAR